MTRVMKELWAQLGSSIASLMFLWAMFHRYFPRHLQASIARLYDRLSSLFYPYIQIRFHEFSRDSFRRNEAYSVIESYLGSKSTKQAKRLKGNVQRNSKSVVLTMDDHEEVSDEFQGIKLVWSLIKLVPTTQSFSFYPATSEKRYYKLTFHMKYREIITGSYLKYVVEEGQAIAFKSRQRKLYTNNPSHNSYSSRTLWSHVVFEHPGSFETMAIDQKKKEEIMDDLTTFSKAKEYYARIGKAWKRGYLLYGPLGQSNTELRKLLIETSSKSIIVIEDIDCSLGLTGQRKKKNQKDGNKEETDPIKKKEEEEDGERQNSKKLDPALIRRGRMDKHIELSYCSFEAFKVLAKNYLNIESHPFFETIGSLLEEISMTPADVAENLMPKTIKGDSETCLESLIQALEAAKKESINAKEELKLRAAKDSKGEESSAKETVGEKEPVAEEEGTLSCAIAPQVRMNSFALNKGTSRKQIAFWHLKPKSNRQKLESLAIFLMEPSVDLTAQPTKTRTKDGMIHPIKKQEEEEGESQSSKVTLSGLWNFIDGLGPVSGGQRLFIFTINYADKLDKATIRRGKIGKHMRLFGALEAAKEAASLKAKVDASDVENRRRH
ncbi:AAA-ATPase [Vitis vinifera]|uniref:AAA-ATPase n=1 Tax=Vitis vinifera TaxID=29760 RepID=A0A438JIL5_VITVI|nr:AAA-ATPase [Vitis vinifera]